MQPAAVVSDKDAVDQRGTGPQGPHSATDARCRVSYERAVDECHYTTVGINPSTGNGRVSGKGAVNELRVAAGVIERSSPIG